MSKFKVAFISKKMDIGGIEKSALDIFNQLDSNRFEIDYYYRHRSNEQVGEWYYKIPVWIKKCPIEIINKTNYKNYYFTCKERLIFWFYYLLSFLVKKKANYIQYILQAKTTIKQKKEYDLAISFDGPTAYGNFYTIENINAKHKVLWIHGDVIKEGATSYLIKMYYLQYNKIITVSGDAKNVLISVFPSLSNRIQVQYNYVDYETIRNKAKCQTDTFIKSRILKITTVGRLAVDKGVITIVDCCKKLKMRNIPFCWIVCGDGPLKNVIEKLIIENDLQDELILTGNKMNPYPYIYDCDIYVQPSVQEGFCTTTNEAKVLCKPVVTTDVCGMREQFENGVNGIIVNNDVDEICSAILRVYLDNELRERIINCLKTIDWSQQTDFNELLESFL